MSSHQQGARPITALDRFTHFLSIARREGLRGSDWVEVLIDAMKGEFDEEIAR